MKRVAWGIALIACLPVFPQDQPASGPGKRFLMYRLRSGDGFRVVADNGRELKVIAKSQALVGDIDGPKPVVVRFTGDVEITTNGMELRADQVDYHWATGEIEPLGNVRLTPVAASNP